MTDDEARQMWEMRELIESIYSPSPAQGLQDRTSVPFDNLKLGGVVTSGVPIRLAASPNIRTKGFTTQEAYVELLITQFDVAPDPGEDRPGVRAEVQLRGSFNSPTAILDSQEVTFDRVGGLFIPARRLTADSFATDIWVEVWTEMDSQYTFTIEGKFRALLAAGPLV